MQYQMLVHAIFSMHVLNSPVGKKSLSVFHHSKAVDFSVITMNRCTAPSILFPPGCFLSGLQEVRAIYFPYLWVQIAHDGKMIHKNIYWI